MTKPVKSYYGVDQSENIMFSMVYSPSGYNYDIGEYKQSTKQLVDDSVKKALKYSGYKILNFSSIFNRKKNAYIADYTIKFTESGQNGYMSTKYIIYKKNIYKWTVIYYDYNQKYIFDHYKKYAKILR